MRSVHCSYRVSSRLVGAGIGSLALALVTPVTAEAVEWASSRDELHTTSGLRIEVATPLSTLDIIEVDEDESNLVDVEADTAYTAELAWYHRTPLYPDTDWRIVTALGVAGTYQDGVLTIEGPPQEQYDVAFTSPALRYNLGLGWQPTEAVHVDLVPYVGVGVGLLDIDHPLLERIEPTVSFEYGCKLRGSVILSAFELGGGIAFDGRSHSSRYSFQGQEEWSINVDQEYLSLFVTAGYLF